MKDKGLNQNNELKSVDYITGADLMLRKEALDKAGLFDERFFSIQKKLNCNTESKNQATIFLLILKPK